MVENCYLCKNATHTKKGWTCESKHVNMGDIPYFIDMSIPEENKCEFVPKNDTGKPALLECDCCHSKKKKMTTWKHKSGKLLNLCFKVCQFNPKPFEAVIPTGDFDNWERIDEFQIEKAKKSRKAKKIKDPIEEDPYEAQSCAEDSEEFEETHEEIIPQTEKAPEPIYPDMPKRQRYKATFVRFGVKTGNKRMDTDVLLANVRDETDSVLMSNIRIPFTNEIRVLWENGLHSGDIIEFNAKMTREILENYVILGLKGPRQISIQGKDPDYQNVINSDEPYAIQKEKIIEKRKRIKTINTKPKVGNITEYGCPHHIKPELYGPCPFPVEDISCDICTISPIQVQTKAYHYKERKEIKPTKQLNLFESIPKTQPKKVPKSRKKQIIPKGLNGMG